MKRTYNSHIAYFKHIRAFKSNRLSIDYRIIFYTPDSDPKLIKDSERTYTKVLKQLAKDKSIINIYEEVEEL